MLFLTYNNKQHTDGFGSQLQRIISIFCLAKEYNCEYTHSGFHVIEYQGLLSLENNTTTDTFIKRANELFMLPSSNVNTFSKIENITFITHELLEYWRSKAKDDNILLRITYAHRYLDSNTHIFSHLPTYPWITNESNDGIVNIAVHIRRGELFLVDSDRMLPDQYFYDVITKLIDILKCSNKQYKLTIYTEKPTKTTYISPKHPGICERFQDIRLIHPEQTDLQIFRNIPDICYKINTDPFETFIELVNSDILVCSLSSFSYSAALLKRNGKVLIPKNKFWHGSLPTWIDTGDTNNLMQLYNK